MVSLRLPPLSFLKAQGSSGGSLPAWNKHTKIDNSREREEGKRPDGRHPHLSERIPRNIFLKTLNFPFNTCVSGIKVNLFHVNIGEGGVGRMAYSANMCVYMCVCVIDVLDLGTLTVEH